jgi:hypothetical protein
MYPWFAWNHNGFGVVGLSALFVLVRFCILSPKTSKRNPGIIFLSILTYFAVHFRIITITGLIIFFCRIFVFFFAIQMRGHEKEKLVRAVTMLYAWIIGVSMVFYILIMFCGITFPYSLLKYPSDGYPEFRNYRFLLMSNHVSFFQRFKSIFAEPGHCGTIAALILYVNKYKLKKISVFVVFAGSLLTLSLAAYVLLILGYCIYQFAAGERIYKKIIILLSVVLLLGGVGLYLYNNYPDSIVTQLIVNRLQYDEGRGIAGNNRTTLEFDYYYEKYFLGTSNMVWGAGPVLFAEKFMWGVGSYKGFFLSYGFVGIISLFMLYFGMVCSINSRLLFGLFILYCASFGQRPYALWEMQVFLFMGAASVFGPQKTKKKTIWLRRNIGIR